MKVKLLKKVRKRYSIIHMPNGFVEYGRHYNYNLYKLIDRENQYNYDIVQCGGKYGMKRYCDTIFETEQECISYLKDSIISMLKRDGYLNRKMRNAQKTHVKKYYLG